MARSYRSIRGASMLYVLAALIVTGFICGALVKMSMADRTAGALYSTSASARAAAKSGMIAATNYFEDLANKDVVLQRLQRWANLNSSSSPVTTLADTLVIGTSTAPESLSVNQSFYVEMTAFDLNRFNVTLRSFGFGKGGSRATQISVVHLDGLGFAEVSQWGGQNAMYIEDGVNLVFRAPVTINGGVRLSNNANFGGFASGSIFNGFFRTEESDTGIMLFRGKYRFNGSTYFGKRPFFARKGADSGYAIIDAMAGFPFGDSLIGFSSSKPAFVDLDSTSYWLSDIETEHWADSATTWHDFNNHRVVQNGSVTFNDSLIKEAAGYDTITAMTNDSIIKFLGMPLEPCEINVHPEVIPATAITSVTSLDASAINLMAPTWNGFVVLQINSGVTVNVTNSDEIKKNKKVIVLVKGTLQPSSSAKVFSVELDQTNGVVNPDSSGHFTVVCMSGGKVANWGGWTQFRGLYYRLGGDIQIGGSLNHGVQSFYGALYAKSGDSIPWYPLASGANSDITYDPTVYSDLDVTGDMVNGNNRFLTKEGCPDDSTTVDQSKMAVVKPKITSRLLSNAL